LNETGVIMGLDMYLEVGIYLSQESKERKAIVKMFPQMKGFEGPDIVNFEIAYWRKANVIHKWFVDNVQDGVDDCKRYYVSKKKLETLLSIIDKIQKDCMLAGELLSPSEIDEHYWENLKYTESQLTLILDNKFLKNHDFYYSSSW